MGSSSYLCGDIHQGHIPVIAFKNALLTSLTSTCYNVILMRSHKPELKPSTCRIPKLSFLPLLSLLSFFVILCLLYKVTGAFSVPSGTKTIKSLIIRGEDLQNQIS